MPTRVDAVESRTRESTGGSKRVLVLAAPFALADEVVWWVDVVSSERSKVENVWCYLSTQFDLSVASTFLCQASSSRSFLV